MGRVFNRTVDQVQSRRKGHQAGRPGLHTTLNMMFSYLLEVDAYLRATIPAPSAERPLSSQEENLLVAGEQLKEDFKLWLSV